jgi:hypothetical protein
MNALRWGGLGLSGARTRKSVEWLEWPESLAPLALFGCGAALALSSAGCTAILGLEDRELAADGGADASSVSASTSTHASTSTSASTGATGSTSIGMTGTATTSTTSTGTTTSTETQDASVVDAADHDAAERDGSGKGEGDATFDAQFDAPVDAPVTADAGVCTASSPGACIVAAGLTAPWLVVADSTSVYWTEIGSSEKSSDGAVKSCSFGACTNPVVYASNVNAPRGIAVDAQRVYWGTESLDTSYSAGVFSCPIAGCGGAPTQLATGIQPYGIAVDATYLYWVDGWDYSVHRVLKDGSGSDAFLVQAYDSANPLYDPAQIAIDQSYVYINERTNGGLYRLPLAGGVEPTLFYAGHDAFDWPVVVDSTYVYYGETYNSSGYVLRINKASSATMTKLVTGLKQPYGLAIDGQSSPLVYWTDWGSGRNDGLVGRVSSAGTGQVNLAAGLPGPNGVAVNGVYAFWTDLGSYDSTNSVYVAGTGYIARVPK